MCAVDSIHGSHLSVIGCGKHLGPEGGTALISFLLQLSLAIGRIFCVQNGFRRAVARAF